MSKTVGMPDLSVQDNTFLYDSRTVVIVGVNDFRDLGRVRVALLKEKLSARSVRVLVGIDSTVGRFAAAFVATASAIDPDSWHRERFKVPWEKNGFELGTKVFNAQLLDRRPDILYFFGRAKRPEERFPFVPFIVRDARLRGISAELLFP